MSKNFLLVLQFHFKKMQHVLQFLRKAATKLGILSHNNPKECLQKGATD